MKVVRATLAGQEGGAADGYAVLALALVALTFVRCVCACNFAMIACDFFIAGDAEGLVGEGGDLAGEPGTLAGATSEAGALAGTSWASTVRALGLSDSGAVQQQVKTASSKRIIVAGKHHSAYIPP